MVRRRKEVGHRNWFEYIRLAGTVFGGLVSVLFFLFFIVLLFGGAGSYNSVPSADIAILPLRGVIVTDAGGNSFSRSGMITSDTIIDWLKSANESDDIKGVILEIDSPGGSPVATDEMAQAIYRFRRSKPIVALIRSVGASGAYWAATATDRIFANRMSIAGSIGVTASYLEFGGLLDSYNVSYRRLVAGKYKDAGSPFRSLTQEEEGLYQDMLSTLHEEFMGAVSANRGLPLAVVRNLSTGFVFLGADAYRLGLVDELGGRDEAVAYLADRLNITDPQVGEFEQAHGLMDLFSITFQRSFYALGSGMGDALARSGPTVRV